MNRTLVYLLLFAFSTALSAQPSIYDESIDVLVKRAGNGDEVAQHALCYRFLYGENVDKNVAKALPWCESAAKAGIPSSQTLLAEIYQSGLGVPVDLERAFSLYKAAAEQGHEHAQLKLGLMYLSGLGTTQNIDAGMDWLIRSAKQGNETAINVLKEFAAAAKSGKK